MRFRGCLLDDCVVVTLRTAGDERDVDVRQIRIALRGSDDDEADDNDDEEDRPAQSAQRRTVLSKRVSKPLLQRGTHDVSQV